MAEWKISLVSRSITPFSSDTHRNRAARVTAFFLRKELEVEKYLILFNFFVKLVKSIAIAIKGEE